MTDDRLSDGPSAALQARLDALQRRRNPTPPASSERPPPRARPAARRQHPAHGSRVGAAAVGVAAMLGLVGAMALARPGAAASSPSSPAAHADPELPTPMVPVASAAGTVTGTLTPPVPLTVAPTVRVTAPTDATPTARTHGSR